CPGGDPGGLDLGLHPAGADPGAARLPDPYAGEVVGAGDLGDQGGGARGGVGVVQPVDVGEEHEQVGAHEVGDERPEPVVVAEADLGGGHGVVLVDDRDDPEVQQRLEGAAGVAVVAAARDV